MLYWLLAPLQTGYVGYGSLSYIVFRAFLAALTAFLVSAVGGRYMVGWLRRHKVGERTLATPIEDARLLEKRVLKQGTPTMGGIIILLGLAAGCLMWAEIGNLYLHLTLFATFSCAVLGVVDDWHKLTGRSKQDRGLRPREKLLIQGLVGLLVGTVLYRYYARVGFGAGSCIFIPFGPKSLIPIGVLMVGWVTLILMTTSNATNITDGMDGLMAGLAILGSLALGAVAYCSGRVDFSAYLHIPYVAGAGELAVFCAALAGACLGFLWWNAYPAQVFMGDTGALAVGAGLGMVAVMTKMEILLPFFCALFLIEFASSLLQIASFHLTGKKILPYAPVHHIFERMGWHESKIVSRFYIAGAVFALFGLSLLKL